MKTEGIIVRTGVPAPLKAPTPWPSTPLVLKSLLPLFSFLFNTLLEYFRQTPHPHATPSCPNPTNQFSLVLNKYQKSDFTILILLTGRNMCYVFCHETLFVVILSIVILSRLLFSVTKGNPFALNITETLLEIYMFTTNAWWTHTLRYTYKKRMCYMHFIWDINIQVTTSVL